jgi:formate dehydrogenase iron-sulfur subunit
MTQLAGGLHLLHGVLFAAGWTEPLPVLARFAMCALLVGLVASVAHLGRPLKAWRAFLGWRRSWMSREIIAFSAYAGLAALLVCAPGNALIAQATALMGVIGISCSAMIYVDTKRPSWPAAIVFTKFLGTALLLGAAGGAVWAGWLAPALAPLLGSISLLLRTALFAWEYSTLSRAHGDLASPLHRSVETAFRFLKPALVCYAILFALSVGCSALAILNVAGPGLSWGVIAFLSTLIAQVLERCVFFTASAPLRMPGAIA